MKKRIFAIAVAYVLALSFALVGCGGGGNSDTAAPADTAASTSTNTAEPTVQADPAENFIGTWELSYMEADGEVIDETTIQQMKDYGMTASLILAEDGSASLDVFGEVMSGGTWTATSATEGTVTFEGSTVPMTLSDQTITLASNGTSMRFTYAGAPTAMPTAAPAATTASAAGTWQLYEMSSTNPDSEYIISHDDVVTAASSGYVVSLILNEDGTGALDLSGETTDISWEQIDDTSISISIDNDTNLGVIDGSMLLLDVDDGDVMVFERA